METPELLAQVVRGPAGSDCRLDVLGSPPGPTVRVLFTRPYFGQRTDVGEYANSQPEALARVGDVASVVAEETVVEIEGDRFVVERSERVSGPGDQWRRLQLRVYRGA